MALSKRHFSIKTLQGAIPRGAPFSIRELRSLGVSSALAYHYLKSGWLAKLGRGVFMFPNDTLRQDDTLKFLSKSITGFHVGGKTALAWRGFIHNIPAREHLSLWGDKRAVLPAWFTERFPSRYAASNLFSKELSKGFGIHPLPETPSGIGVSEPERALLELLSEVWVHQGIEETRNIMEGARSLRTDVLAELLKQCNRVKVRLLCLRWAEELNLSWAVEVRKALGPLRGQSRWTARLKDGTILNIKP